MDQSGRTYRAVQVVAKGQFKLVERPVVAPPPGEVRIRVQACGVCHSDAGPVEGGQPVTWPRVPGHEIVGVIDAIGPDVRDWTIGQRVGVGYLGGPCGRCAPCRHGDLVNCRNQPVTGLSRDGGYAEMMLAQQRALVSIPDALRSVDAAPLLCAGLTTFNALRKSGAGPGDLVAVIGIGGLGHLAVQYAAKMGFEVAAIGRGPDKDGLSRKLGAHHYIDNAAEDSAQALQALGGAAAIVATAGGKAVSDAFPGLRERGRMVVVGVSPEPIEIGSVDLLFGTRELVGSLTGDPGAGDDVLRFSTLAGVAPMVETMPLSQAPEAYRRMMHGEARFRLVLTMDA